VTLPAGAGGRVVRQFEDEVGYLYDDGEFRRYQARSLHSPHGTIRMRARAGTRRPLIVVASEPMDEDLGWKEVASGELVHIGPDLEVRR
jgi:predicted glutamine amidotransferase